MTRKTRIFAIFVLVCAAQLALPAYTILTQERTIRHGELYRFRCEPIDPVDFFRGRYVALGFAERSVTADPDAGFTRGESIYVSLTNGPDGYARISTPSRTRPEGGDYLRVKVLWQNEDQLTIDLPFSRYYVEEGVAPEAERAYFEQLRREDVEVYAVVRTLDGNAALGELYLDGLPLREFLASAPDP